MTSSIPFILVCSIMMAFVPPVALAGNELTRAHGGTGGSSFLALPAGTQAIAGVRIRAGKYVDSIQVAYRERNNIVWGPRHGGGGGTPNTIMFRNNERIIEVGGRSGKYVDAIYVRTNRKKYRTYGGNGGKPFRFQGRVDGFWGRSGNLLDAIGVVTSAPQRSDAVSGQSLTGYAPAAGGGDDKADSAPSVLFPGRNSNVNGLRQWLGDLALRLEQTIKSLAGSDQVYRRYADAERSYCNDDLYCQVAYREDAIAYAVGRR